MQVVAAARVAPQLLAVMAKSAELVPVTVIPAMLSVLVPELESTVLIEVAVLPTVVLGKERVVGVRMACGASEAVPVPDNTAVWGEPAALSATDIDAVKVAADAGVKVTEIMHVAAAARVAPQVLAEMAKSAVLAPVTVIPVMLSVAVPGFDRTVLIEVEVLPTAVLGKARVVGVRTACGAVPVPVNFAICGEPLALSDTDTVAIKLVTKVGVKMTEMVQVAEATKVVPHVLVCVKSAGFAPVMETEIPVNEALPVFDKTMVEAALVVLTAWLPKAMETGESEATGALAAVPVPFRVIVWTVPLTFNALSVALTAPVMLPEATGLKLIGSVQEVAAAKVAALPALVVNVGQAVLPVLLTLKLVETLGFVPVPGIGKDKGALPMFENITV